MLVHCFTITRTKENPITIDTVYAELSKGPDGSTINIPQYLQYEGGSFNTTTFLCCVDVLINVQEICKKYNYDCGTLYKIEIDYDTYNSGYKVYPTYCRPSDGPKYKLRLNP
jgi:hypothetical protein